jgi:MOSC domain-containing protein YiiM
MNNTGRIFQINISPQGGVPKQAVREAEIDGLGIVGSRVAHPDIHGGEARALCLYSVERIQALQDEGHPIFPGSVGENLTLGGLDWAQLTPGARLQLGDLVLVEVTRYTTPCQTIVESFADRDSNRILQKTHPGWSRVYAKVLRAGRIRVGDHARVSPRPAETDVPAADTGIGATPSG